MAPRSIQRVLALATAGLMAAAVAGLHAALVRAEPLDAESCEVYVRTGGEERWIPKPLEFCGTIPIAATATAIVATATSVAATGTALAATSTAVVATATAVQATATAQIATATAAAAATRTPTPPPPSPPPTSAPSNTPAVPSATPLAMAAWNGVPICTAHNPMVWHALVIRDASGAIICTHTHHHGDDPSTVSDVLGPPGQHWGKPGEAYSYPWLSSPLEQADKHNLFKTIVRRDLPNVNSGGNYFKHFRATTHLLGSGGHIPGTTSKDGFQTQVHSWQLEAVICSANNDCGILRTGGFQDIGSGNLALPNQPPGEETCVLPNAYSGTGCTYSAMRHGHGAPGGSRFDFTWYANTGPPYREVSTSPARIAVDFGTIGQPWAHVDPNDYNALPFIDPDTYTASWLSQEILGMNFPGYFPNVVNGRITMTAWTDNWGNVVPSGCSMAMVTCVPLVMQNVPVGGVQYRDSALQAQTGQVPWTEHDVRVTVNGQSKSLTRYPN